MTLALRKRVLSRTRTPGFLEGLSGAECLTLYLPPHLPEKTLENALQQIRESSDILNELTRIAGRSETGAAVFWGPEVKYAVLPSFPISEQISLDSLDTERLRAMVERDRLIALVLVRLGSYAIGVFKGEERMSSKVGTGLVHGRHRQGGSSAHRFERHRDKQIEYFLTRVCRHSREQIEPYVKSLDYVVYGGARTTIQLLRKQCSFIGRLEAPALPSLLDIPEPRQAVLEDAITRVWSSTIYEWRED